MRRLIAVIAIIAGMGLGNAWAETEPGSTVQNIVQDMLQMQGALNHVFEEAAKVNAIQLAFNQARLEQLLNTPIEIPHINFAAL